MKLPSQYFMINHSEFRIGNYIQHWTFSNEKQRLMQEYKEVSVAILSDITKSKSGYSAIALSENWLFELGFREVDKHSVTGHTIYVHPFHPIVHLVNKFDWKSHFVHIMIKDLKIGHLQYVHQLQNFFFFLNGMELA
ncbi:MAG: hypothetical protein INR73_20330 [Williamsia sp.]|nr:hypothetical protein [Williamsia sp.]